MFPSDVEIMQFFAQYAHSPALIYTTVIVMMFLSSFGLPLPEEVTILALGLIVFMGNNPDLYPPPEGMIGNSVNLWTAMIVCFFAIFLSDLLVYFIGRKFGDSPLLHRLFKRFLGEDSLEKSRKLIHDHRFWVPAIFRFTPGIRFPGHLSCGMMRIPVWSFVVADGLAALVSVPTQIYVFATYGEVIISSVKVVKQYVLVGGGVVLVGYLIYKFRSKIFSAST